ncbi:Protein abrupt [Armadillidium vulgare]|nr:Protein abrupt [Armadillidium vulgare]
MRASQLFSIFTLKTKYSTKIFSFLLLLVVVLFLFGQVMYSGRTYNPKIATQFRRFLNSIDQVDTIRESNTLEDNESKVTFVQIRPEGLVDVSTEEERNEISQNKDKGLGKQGKQTNLKEYEGEIYFNSRAAWNGGSFRYNPVGNSIYDDNKRGNYIPKERIIHLDLKGAPLLPSAYKVLIPWLAKYGATTILMEYEDMFPWEGSLASLAAKNSYSKNDVKNFLALCKKNNIAVIPLVQTFGHLEFALKLPEFSHLREVPELPLALCPSQEDSQVLVRSMIDQIMKLHPDVKYIHIGCDEVFQMGECNKCRLKPRDKLFLEHVSKTATYVRDTYNITPIIWHDMLGHVSERAMKEYNFGKLVEPMVWVYAEDVYHFVQPTVWNKFGKIFPYVWGASAFKGAFGQQSTAPNILRHLNNNLNWLDVMASETPKFTGGFRGLVLTGWQRHDHFAVLCELIPSALPSLAITLITVSHGYFNSSIYPEIFKAISCSHSSKHLKNLNNDNDPFFWERFAFCTFPGSSVFKATARLDSIRNDITSFIEKVTLQRAWITDYNRRHNFSSPMRIDEDLEEFPSRLHELNTFIESTKDALSEWYDSWTVGEWIEQHIWPLLDKLQTLQREAQSMKKVRNWPSRPLPLLKQLEAFGIKEQEYSQRGTPIPEQENKLKEKILPE